MCSRSSAASPRAVTERAPRRQWRPGATRDRAGARGRHRARSDRSKSMTSPSHLRSGTLATSRPPKTPRSDHAGAGDDDRAPARGRRALTASARPKTSTVSIPPKPKSSTARRESRAPRRASRGAAALRSGCSRPPSRTMPFAIAIAVIVASIAPAQRGCARTGPSGSTPGHARHARRAHARGPRLHRGRSAEWPVRGR